LASQPGVETFSHLPTAILSMTSDGIEYRLGQPSQLLVKINSIPAEPRTAPEIGRLIVLPHEKA